MRTVVPSPPRRIQMTNKKQRRYDRFDGGLNNRDSPYQIAANEASDLLNVEPGETGSFAKRWGYGKRHQTQLDGPVTGAFIYRPSGGEPEELVTAGSKVYRYDPDEGEYVEIFDGLTPGQPTEWTQIQDRALMVNGADGIWEYDGETFAKVTPYEPEEEEASNVLADEEHPIHKARIILRHRNRVFYIGSPDAPSTAWYGELPDPGKHRGYNYVRSLNFWEFETNDGSVIVGAALFYGYIIIGKDRSIHIWDTEGDPVTDWWTRSIHDEIGWTSHRSVQLIDNVLAFWSRGGPYGLTTTEIKEFLNVVPLGQKIPATVRRVTDPSKIVAVDVAHKHQLWFAVPMDGPTNDHVLVYDYHAQSWWIWDNIHASTFLINDDNTVIWGSVAAGQLYEFERNRYNDDGAPIDAFYQTLFDGMDYPANPKAFWDFILQGKAFPGTSYTLDVTYEIDGFGSRIPGVPLEGEQSIWGEFRWGESVWGGQSIMEYSGTLSGEGKHIRFRFRNNRLDETFEIFGLSLIFTLKPAR